MKDYSTIPNISGAFPNVVSQNASGPGETDGTPFIKQLIDDLWGARQAVMNEAGLTPSGSDESASNSQFLQAIKQIILDNIKVSPIGPRNLSLADTVGGGINDVGYALGHFLAPGNVATNQMQRSFDGNEWTSQSLPTAQDMRAVFGGGIYVATVGKNAALAYATDPAGSWAGTTIAGAGDLEDVHYGNGIWLACDLNGDLWYKSGTPSGTWTQRTNPASVSGAAVRALLYVSSLNLWIAVGDKTGSFSGIMTATDPTGTWTERTNPIGGSAIFRDLAFDGTNIIAVGGSGASYGNCVISTDGISWTDKSSSLPQGSGQEVESVAADPYGHILIFQDATIQNVYFSDDGCNTWETVFYSGSSSGGNGAYYIPEIGQFVLGSDDVIIKSLKVL